MFTCSTLLLFPYTVPADRHGSVQHVTLECVPVDALPRLFVLFSQVKHFECHYICPPQEVQCVHIYSVAWDVLDSLSINHCFTETGWELSGREAVWWNWGEGGSYVCVWGGGAVA